MFTVKHSRKSDGVTHVQACDSYETSKRAPRLTLLAGAARHEITVEPGDVVYIENVKGKTIDVVKYPS